MANKKWKIGLAALLSLVATASEAQYIRPAYAYPTAPVTAGGGGMTSVQVGDSPLYVAPYIGAAVGHDSNLFLTRNNTRSSNLYIVSPGLKLDARSEASVFQLGYQAQIGRYTSSRDDDYVDQTLRAQYDVAFSGRSFLRLGMDYLRLHDPRGSTDRPPSGVPDRYRLNTPSVTYAYGAPGAQGRVELYASHMHKVYLNNRAATASADRAEAVFGGAFYWRVMPKTYAMAEVRNTEIHYDIANPATGEERRYYVGAMWEATAATTGVLKVGQLRRTFDNGSPSTKNPSWEALVTWAPLTYSTFDFYSSQQTSESTGLGRFLLTSVTGVTWNHAWSSFLSSSVGFRYIKDEYQGFDRTDDTKAVNFKLGYRFRRWLTIGGEYTYSRRDSNLPQFEYNKNLYMLTATASM
jgi:polysaccharide biosynthesis protein VpsM